MNLEQQTRPYDDDKVGAIIAIGGAEDTQGKSIVLSYMLACGRGTNVHVITTATALADSARDRYQRAFSDLGVQSCEISHIADRRSANNQALADSIAAADVIFFSGGDQLKLTHIFGGTAVLGAIKNANRQGTVVAGTSAGAAVLSELMIYGGSVENAGLKGAIKATSGFGFIKNMVIDTHFSQRKRLPRLFQLVATNPGLLAIGIDEDTAIVKCNDSLLHVIGSGAVTLVDGSTLSSNIAEKNIGESFNASGYITHRLRAGETYDVKARSVSKFSGPGQNHGKPSTA